MEHSDEQVLLFSIRKEFHIAFAAMMADHCETGNAVVASVLIVDGDEPPVHLVCFTGSGVVTEPAVALWIDHLPLGRNKIPVL